MAVTRISSTSAPQTGGPLTERRYILPLMLITSLFFLWAVGVNLNDILIPHLKGAFHLTDFESSFVQVAFFGGYFIAAWPAGRLMEKIGYQRGIVCGLLICACGAFLFIPAASVRMYAVFLLGLFVMACGQSFLEVSANPYVTFLGPPQTSEQRLNVAQSFNAVGAVVTPILGSMFILSRAHAAPAGSESDVVRGPYLVMVGIFAVMALIIYFAKLPVIEEEEAEEESPRALGISGVSAFAERCGRAIFLHRGAGGRGKFCDSLCAAYASGDAGHAGSELSETASAWVYDRALCWVGTDEEDSACTYAGRLCCRMRRVSSAW